MARWIAVVYDGIGDMSDAVIVEDADTEVEAAQYAAECFETFFEEDAKPIDHIFIAPWTERVAYTVTVAVRRSEMQCCGGPAPLPGGHWGGCQLAARDEEAEPEPEHPSPTRPMGEG